MGPLLKGHTLLVNQLFYEAFFANEVGSKYLYPATVAAIATFWQKDCWLITTLQFSLRHFMFFYKIDVSRLWNRNTRQLEVVIDKLPSKFSDGSGVKWPSKLNFFFPMSEITHFFFGWRRCLWWQRPKPRFIFSSLCVFSFNLLFLDNTSYCSGRSRFVSALPLFLLVNCVETPTSK